MSFLNFVSILARRWMVIQDILHGAYLEATTSMVTYCIDSDPKRSAGACIHQKSTKVQLLHPYVPLFQSTLPQGSVYYYNYRSC